MPVVVSQLVQLLRRFEARVDNWRKSIQVVATTRASSCREIARKVVAQAL